MREKTGQDRLDDIKAYKESKEKLEIQHKYKELADKALVDPRSFSFYFTTQQAEFIINLYESIRKAPFRAVQSDFETWIDKVSNPKNKEYLYVLKKSGRLIIDYYRIRKDFPIK